MITANTTHTIMPSRTTATTTPTITGTGLELEELELELEEGKTSNFIATSEKSTLHRTDSLTHKHTQMHLHTYTGIHTYQLQMTYYWYQRMDTIYFKKIMKYRIMHITYLCTMSC